VGTSTGVFIQPLPSTDAKYQVADGGGRAPVWSPDGKQLFFFHNSATNRFFVADVHVGQGLTFGTPVPLPNVVLNWFEELRARAPRKP